MKFSSVTGKNWIYKKFDSSVVTDLVEKYSLTELSAKLLSIRKNNMFGFIFYFVPCIFVNSFHKKFSTEEFLPIKLLFSSGSFSKS